MIDFNDIGKYQENNRIEAKKALGGLPESLWETYSAFANTLGGVILLGVEELPGKALRCVNLPDPAKLIHEFRSLLADPHKVSVNILSDEDIQIHDIDGRHIISIAVPRAQRSDKPVFVNNSLISGTYRRNGEGDYHCSKEEIQAMIRDAAIRTHDMQVIESMPIDALNYDTVTLCRRCSDSLDDITDPEFLFRIGAAAKAPDENIHPTIAGLLMFGRIRDILRYCPEYCMRCTSVDGKTKRYEQNILDFYFTMRGKISLCTVSSGYPDVEKGICEALTNSLINADYYGSGGVCVLFSRDCIQFTNPGSFRVNREHLYRGGISDPRNSAIFRIFRQMNIGRGTGSGIQNIFGIWKKHGFSTPEIKEYFKPDRITVTLPLTGNMKNADSSRSMTDITAGTAAIVEYLTYHVSADLDAICAALGFDRQYGAECIQILTDRNFITNQDGVYYLKA